MNILFVTREFPPSRRCGGIGTYVKETAAGLAQSGHNVCVLAASDNIWREFVEIVEGVTVYRLKGGDFFIYSSLLGKIYSKLRSIIFYNSYRKRIWRQIERITKEKAIDIIELAEFGNEGKYWLMCHRIPTIVRFHGPSGLDRKTLTFKYNRRSRRELLDAMRSEGWSFVSESMKSLILSQKLLSRQQLKYSGIIEVIPNSIELRVYRKEQTVGGKVYILGAGTIVKEKGWVELLNACAAMTKANFEILLKIYGRNSSVEPLISKEVKIAQKIGLSVELLGQVPRERLFQEYANADICCFPSWFEPFGLTVIEAMSQGSIVVASSSGAGREIIQDGINGFLVAPRDTMALEETLKKIINLPEATKDQIRANAGKTIQENFTNVAVIPKIEAYYKRAIDEFHRKQHE